MRTVKKKEPVKDAAEDSELWSMDSLQKDFEKTILQAREEGNSLTDKQVERIALRTFKSTGKIYYRELIATAAPMLVARRKEQAGFEARNLRRWRKAFDLLETIWVCCEEVGSGFNDFNRPAAIEAQDHVFEAMTYLHAKALLVTSEIICLLKGGFADGALARWRTLYENNVIAYLIRQEGQDLALRYVAHSRVQAWQRAQLTPEEKAEISRDLEEQAEYAISKFGDGIKSRYGWASNLLGKKHPTFKDLAAKCGHEGGGGFYEFASQHIHFNHRMFDELLANCESEKDVLIVGPSNSGMVMPMTMAAISISEATSLLLLHKPNLDRLSMLDSIWRMARRMAKLSSGLEKRTFEAAKRRGKVGGNVAPTSPLR